MKWYYKNRERKNLDTRNIHYKTRRLAIKFLGGKCADCGNKNTEILEFDHVVKNDDYKTISSLTGYKWERVKKELGNCELVCSNCHIIRTKKRLGKDMGKLFDVVAQNIGEIAVPAKPPSFGEEYNFPVDPTLLSSDEISKWMFRLGAWNGYILRSLALSEVVVMEAKYNYDSAESETLLSVDNIKGKTKAQLYYEASRKNPSLLKVKQTLDKAVAEMAALERVHKLYESQIAVLSREITRRISEQK